MSSFEILCSSKCIVLDLPVRKQCLVFFTRAIGSVILVILQSTNPLTIQQLGAQGKCMAPAVDGRASRALSIVFSRELEGKRELSVSAAFVCIIVKC